MKKQNKKAVMRPLHTLQFGGLSNIPMFDVFNNMNTQWNSFWRGNGDYFNPGAQTPYDPTVYGSGLVTGQSHLVNTLNANNQVLNTYNTAKNFDKNYKGFRPDTDFKNPIPWSQTDPNNLAAISFYKDQHNEKYKDRINDFNAYADNPTLPKPEGYDEFHAFDPSLQWSKDRAELTANQQLSAEAKKGLGAAFNNTATGIFTGLQHLNKWKPEEQINTKRGFQGVQYAQDGGMYGPQNRTIIPMGGPQYGQELPATFSFNGVTPSMQGINTGVSSVQTQNPTDPTNLIMQVMQQKGGSVQDAITTIMLANKEEYDNGYSHIFRTQKEKSLKELEADLDFYKTSNRSEATATTTQGYIDGLNKLIQDKKAVTTSEKIKTEETKSAEMPILETTVPNKSSSSNEPPKKFNPADKPHGITYTNSKGEVYVESGSITYKYDKGIYRPLGTKYEDGEFKSNTKKYYQNPEEDGYKASRKNNPTEWKADDYKPSDKPDGQSYTNSKGQTYIEGSNGQIFKFEGGIYLPLKENEEKSYKASRKNNSSEWDWDTPDELKNNINYQSAYTRNLDYHKKGNPSESSLRERLKTMEKYPRDKFNDPYIRSEYDALKTIHREKVNARNGIKSKAMGGYTNLTGFTPNTPTMNNQYNKIPGDIVQTQQTPFNLLGIGSTGEIKIMQANNPDPYKFWGAKHVTEIPSFQYGGEVGNPNSVFSMPIIPSMMEDKLEYLQTEDGEVVFLPDGTIADVKATKKHKSMKKDDVTDILPSGYVFSNDPKMKFSRKSSILGTKFEDMNLGKTAFEYKENEITKGPEDIKLTDMFFGTSKKELTTADIAKNIKKNLPLVDLKGDWFADTANEENKAQRVEYLTILKTFNEFKKPKKSKMQPPQQMQMQQQMGQAQYGMQTTAPKNYFNLGMDYMNKTSDPFARMDNNMVTRFSANNQFNNLPTYQYGGGIRQAPLGMAIGAAVAPLLGNLVGHFTGRSARKKQERINREDLIRFSTLQDNLRAGINQGIGLDNLTNLSTYAAGLNVPLSRFDDMTSQRTMSEEAFRKQRLMLQSSKMTAGTYSGLGSSMARYMNPSNMGGYLASLDNHNKDITTRINEQLAELEGQRANANIGFQTQGTANRNNALNARDTQLYNVNVSGIGNIGNSLASGQKTRANMNYQLGMEKMTYEDMQRQKAQAAYDRMRNRTEGIFNNIGAGIGGIGNYMDIEGKTNSSSKTLQGMPTLPNSYKFVQNPNELHKLPSKTSPLVDFQINERRYPGPPSLYLQQWSPIEDRYPYDNAPQMPFGPLNMNGAPQFNFGYGPFGSR